MAQPTVIWEITGSCDLYCFYCPDPVDDRRRSVEQLSTYEAYKTVDQIASLNPKKFIISGGDPLARPDLFQIVEYAHRRGLRPAVALIPTLNLTAEPVVKLHDSGAATVIFSLNGPTAALHDVSIGLRGAFERTMRAIERARTAGLAVEINTLLTRRSIGDLVAIAGLLTSLGVQAWNIYFVVPVGASRKMENLTPEEAEVAFDILATIQEKAPALKVRTVEAPGYRRFLIQRRYADVLWSDYANYLPEEIADCSMDDVVVIGRNGAVRPSELLPITAGNLRYRPLSAIVRASDVFVAFRDRSNLTGKCARCEYRQVCGGSRARSWAATGMLFGPDPICAYQPPVITAKEAAR